MTLDFFILTICSTAISALGLLIFLRNPQAANNRRFAFLALSLVLWTVANFLSDHSTTNIRWYTRLTFLGGVLSIYALINFLTNFPRELTLAKTKLLRLHGGLTVILAVGSMTPFLITRVLIEPEVTIETSFLYPVYLGYVLLSLVLIVKIIRRQYKTAQSAIQKQQIVSVSRGVMLYAFFAVASNVALPLLFDSWSSSSYGPIFTLFLVGMVAYTIVRHGLFDIRLIVARTLGYVGSLAVVAVIFGFIILNLAQWLFDLDISIGAEIFISIATGLVSVYFHSLQRIFDKITNKLFFRDAYDTQTFLDQFNKTLVTTYDLLPLLRKSAAIIEENLKPTYALFGLKETAGSPRRIIGTSRHPGFTEKDIAFVRSLTPTMRRKVIVTDMLEVKYSHLQKVLQDNNIAVIARLASSTNSEGIGYLILGVKKSGNPYSAQDLKVVEIIANELVVAIQNALHTEEIENFNLTLQAKVDDATRKLRATNEKLKALDETKDDFISMASHQLRTPLTSVKGYISMVLEGDAGKLNETQTKLLEQSFYSSQRMVFLIADLLNVSRLRTGKFVIEPVPVDLAQMVQEEVDQLHEGASSKNLTLTYEKPAGFPMLMLDDTKTRQVVMNFIDNALYYTPAGGHVRVELNETPASVELRVIDDGIGVPKHEQHHLFTKFYRAGNARKARPDGTGLGLFMAKKVVVGQGGAVIFQSEEGKGSTFGFVFSKTKLAPATSSKSAPAKKMAKT